jgi:hypothetical protein
MPVISKAGAVVRVVAAPPPPCAVDGPGQQSPLMTGGYPVSRSRKASVAASAPVELDALFGSLRALWPFGPR